MATEEDSLRRWHTTGTGSDQAPSLFRLSGRHATLFIVSLGFAFLAFTLLTSVGLGFVAAVALSSSVPAAMLLFLLSLCCGRHEGYAGHWLAWRLLKLSGRGLLKTGNHHED